ncbi:MAG TPA: methyltransferase [Amycolatopsis sp.]|uniref:class I SAM-dependent methyltransferase n=1 Tax=Amycolatopsis sp. TaxID=37632 RepID=UPI002B46E580|nr:methyltransferase [Amycolatopsis sp.]HKS46959.1 methyltransferase [Amycolatopsis sp.]
MPDALEQWSEQLAAWAIPEHILAGTPESPWVLNRKVFVRRVEKQLAGPRTPTHAAVLEALAGSGTVLDVGAGAGAASLPCASAITHVTAVDIDAELLAEFAARATVPHRLVEGRWPDVGAPRADVVVCANVLYNAPDLASFVRALTGHAHRKVVVEIAEAHPLTTLNALWRHFHGIDRPAGPTADDALAALRQLGIDPEVVRWRREPLRHQPFEEAVDVTRRQLCLPPERAGEIAHELRRTAPSGRGTHGMVTFAWGSARLTRAV